MPPSTADHRQPRRLATAALSVALAVLLPMPLTALPATAAPDPAVPAPAVPTPAVPTPAVPRTAPDVCANAPRTTFVDAAAIADAQREAVQCLAAYGITRGVDAQPTFAPAAAVTREQMATFLTRTAMQARYGTIEIPPDGDVEVPDHATSTFLDVADDSVHAPAIGWLADREIAAGTGAQTFTPRGLVTRQQLASFLARLLRELGAYDDLELDAVLETFPGERFTDL